MLGRSDERVSPTVTPLPQGLAQEEVRPVGLPTAV
jgi:hypothetical protein